jgi:hypothetical protein
MREATMTPAFKLGALLISGLAALGVAVALGSCGHDRGEATMVVRGSEKLLLTETLTFEARTSHVVQREAGITDPASGDSIVQTFDGSDRLRSTSAAIGSVVLVRAHSADSWRTARRAAYEPLLAAAAGLPEPGGDPSPRAPDSRPPAGFRIDFDAVRTATIAETSVRKAYDRFGKTAEALLGHGAHAMTPGSLQRSSAWYRDGALVADETAGWFVDPGAPDGVVGIVQVTAYAWVDRPVQADLRGVAEELGHGSIVAAAQRAARELAGGRSPSAEGEVGSGRAIAQAVLVHHGVSTVGSSRYASALGGSAALEGAAPVTWGSRFGPAARAAGRWGLPGAAAAAFLVTTYLAWERYGDAVNQKILEAAAAIAGLGLLGSEPKPAPDTHAPPDVDVPADWAPPTLDDWRPDPESDDDDETVDPPPPPDDDPPDDGEEICERIAPDAIPIRWPQPLWRTYDSVGDPGALDPTFDMPESRVIFKRRSAFYDGDRPEIGRYRSRITSPPFSLTIPAGHAIHHKVPLYLGGPGNRERAEGEYDAEGEVLDPPNLVVMSPDVHRAWHRYLEEQPQGPRPGEGPAADTPDGTGFCVVNWRP